VTYQQYLKTEQAGKPTLPLTEQERKLTEQERKLTEQERNEQNVQQSGAKERTQPDDLREQLNNIGKPLAKVKAEAEYMSNRAAVQAEDAKLDAQEHDGFGKGSPTDEEEAMHAQWLDNQAADRDEMAAEYGVKANAADAETADTGASEAEGEAPGG
jgi:hypothetical protein